MPKNEMKLNNFPLYRAKRKEKNEYITGYFITKKLFKGAILTTIPFIFTRINISGYNEDGSQKTNNWDNREYKIEENTLAIHFPGMLDKEFTKLFASLNEKGIGGDTVIHYDDKERTLVFDERGCIEYFEHFEDFKKLSIKETND